MISIHLQGPDFTSMVALKTQRTLQRFRLCEILAFHAHFYASHIRNLAAEKNSPMPITDIVLQHLLTARALHSSDHATGSKFPQLDMTSLAAGARVAAGLDPFDSTTVRRDRLSLSSC